jgi:hypothetical protein
LRPARREPGGSLSVAGDLRAGRGARSYRASGRVAAREAHQGPRAAQANRGSRQASLQNRRPGVRVPPPLLQSQSQTGAIALADSKDAAVAGRGASMSFEKNTVLRRRNTWVALGGATLSLSQPQSRRQDPTRQRKPCRWRVRLAGRLPRPAAAARPLPCRRSTTSGDSRRSARHARCAMTSGRAR